MPNCAPVCPLSSVPSLELPEVKNIKMPTMSIVVQCGWQLRYIVGCVSAGSGNIASGQQSDHLLMAAAYNGWLAAKHKVS